MDLSLFNLRTTKLVEGKYGNKSHDKLSAWGTGYKVLIKKTKSFIKRKIMPNCIYFSLVYVSKMLIFHILFFKIYSIYSEQQLLLEEECGKTANLTHLHLFL